MEQNIREQGHLFGITNKILRQIGNGTDLSDLFSGLNYGYPTFQKEAPCLESR